MCASVAASAPPLTLFGVDAGQRPSTPADIAAPRTEAPLEAVCPQTAPLPLPPHCWRALLSPAGETSGVCLSV